MNRAEQQYYGNIDIQHVNLRTLTLKTILRKQKGVNNLETEGHQIIQKANKQQTSNK